MGSFRQSPGGVGVLPYDALGDIDTGIAPWGSAAISSIATGFQNTGAGFLATQAGLPPLALTLDESYTGGLQVPMPTRELTEDETNKRGYVLAQDPALFNKMFPTVPHEPGMTIERAIAIKEYQDSQAVRDFYMKDRPITSFVGQLSGGVPTPENFIPFLGQLGASLKVGYATKIAIGAARSSGEAIIGTAAFDLATREGRAQLGQDTSWEAMAMDIGFSALIGAGFGTVTSFINTPTQSSTPPSILADSPEARAKANVIMNDAIGSFINSPDNAVHLGPQSYRYISDTATSVPEAGVTFTWDNIRAEDAKDVQSYVSKYIMSDPGMAWMKGTKVADSSGKPLVVYTGSPQPIRGRLETLNQTTGIVMHPEDAKRLGIKYNPDTWTGPVDLKEYDGPADASAVRIGKKTFIGTEHQDALQNAINNLGLDHPSVKAFDKHPERKIGKIVNGKFVPFEDEAKVDLTARDRELADRISEAKARGDTKVTEGDMSFKAINESVIWFSDNPRHAEAYANIPRVGQENQPTIVPALVDMKNPYIREYKTMPNEMNRWSQIAVAKDNDHDGVIFKVKNDGTGKSATLYATWQPDNIIGVADASARRIRDEQARKVAEYQNMSNMAQNAGYSYNTPKYREYSNIQGAELTPVVNIDALAKEANILKYSEGVVKAAGGNLETGITPLDEQFKAYTANRELTQETLKGIEEADTLIKKTKFLEDIMLLAVGCKDG